MSEERSWSDLQAAYARGELVDEPLLLMLLEPPAAEAPEQSTSTRLADDVTPPADDASRPAVDAEPRPDPLREAERGGASIDAD